MAKQTITDFYGRIIGYISTDEKTGDKTATDFYGRTLGYYKKNLNITTNFYNQIIARGDAVASLVYDKAQKEGTKK
jgi:hypothetical protein